MGDNNNQSSVPPAIPEDSDAPYESFNTSQLPEWWQEAIEEFEEHGLRPYHPPRFNDGELKYRVVERLEETHDIEIDFIGMNVDPGDEWQIRIDGEPVTRVGHQRASEGYSIFEVESDEFEEVVSAHVS